MYWRQRSIKGGMEMGACRDGFEIRRGDSGYPRCVAELPQVPPVLYVRGDARRCLIFPRCPSSALAVHRLTVRLSANLRRESPSSRAYPLYRAVRADATRSLGWATLNAGGRHIVVLGTGADVVYPSTAKALVDRVIETGGRVISIEPWERPHRDGRFPSETAS